MTWRRLFRIILTTGTVLIAALWITTAWWAPARVKSRDPVFKAGD